MSHLAPELMGAPPTAGVRGRRDVHRLRALVPPTLALLCHGAGVPGGLALFALGVLGGILVWREDGQAPIVAWSRRFPRVPFGAVERLPCGAGAPALARVCAIVEEAERALRGAAERQGVDRRRLRQARGDLAGIVALAAGLAVQVDEAAADGPHRGRLTDTLASVEEAAGRLRDTARRMGTAEQSPYLLHLTALRSLERDLSAEQDCRDELEEL